MLILGYERKRSNKFLKTMKNDMAISILQKYNYNNSNKE